MRSSKKQKLTLALSLKPEWRMTAKESVNNRIAELQEVIKSLWRKRDFPDSEGVSPARLRRINQIHERIMELKRMPVNAVIHARRLTIIHALRDGKSVPLKVLGEYTDVKRFGNVRSVKIRV